MRTAPGVFALVIAMALMAPSGVSAHARYESSTPGKGEVVAASPPSVTITFTQDVQKISGTYGIDVVSPDGASAVSGESTLSDDDRRIMNVELQPNLPPGRYVVDYKNVSDIDGDAWAGAFSFYVGVEPTAADLAADELLAGEDEDEQTPEPTGATGETPAATVTDESTPSSGSVGDDDDEDDDGGVNVPLLVAGAAVVLAVVGGGAWYAMRGGRAS